MIENVFEAVRGVSSVDAARALGLDVRQKGGKHWVLCPFHADKKAPSLALYEGDGGWYCYGCHLGGDAVKLFELYGRMSPIDAAYALAAAVGIRVPDRDSGAPVRWEPSPEAVRRAAIREARDWLNRRYAQVADVGHAAFAAAVKIDVRGAPSGASEGVPDAQSAQDIRDGLWEDGDFLQAVRLLAAAEDEMDRLDAISRDEDALAEEWMYVCRQQAKARAAP